MNEGDDPTLSYLIQDSDDGSKWSMRMYHWTNFESNNPQDFIVVPLVFDEGGHFPTQKSLDVIYSTIIDPDTLSSWGTFWRETIDKFLDNNWPLYEIEGDLYIGDITFDDGGVLKYVKVPKAYQYDVWDNRKGVAGTYDKPVVLRDRIVVPDCGITPVFLYLADYNEDDMNSPIHVYQTGEDGKFYMDILFLDTIRTIEAPEPTKEVFSDLNLPDPEVELSPWAIYWMDKLGINKPNEDEMKAITIYGQAFISGDALVQDQILLTEKTQSENTIVLIENIWDDLKSASGQWKAGKNGYFYWEVDMTDTEDVEKKVKVKVSCPKPGPDLFDYDFESSDSDSDWTKYWKAKMKAVEDSPYNSVNGIQPKEVTFPGSKYINQNGEVVEVEETKVTRDNLGDIQNLLLNLY